MWLIAALKWIFSPGYRERRRQRKRIQSGLKGAKTGGLPKSEATGTSRSSKQKKKKRKLFRQYHPPKPRKQKRGR